MNIKSILSKLKINRYSDAAENINSNINSNIDDKEQLALDNLGVILHLWGKHSVEHCDADDGQQSIKEQFDQWARHILVLSSPPSGKDQSQRDWFGLRQFISAVRLQEKEVVTKQLDELRTIIQEISNLFEKVISDDAIDQKDFLLITKSLEKCIANSVPINILSTEVLEAIKIINRIVMERNARYENKQKELYYKITQLRTELDQTRKEVGMDPLTKIFNRGAFDKHISKVCEISRLSGTAASLILLDVDHFKEINDSYGHLVGDFVIQNVANRCQYMFPRKTDFVARFGGDEFVIVLQDTDLETSVILTERLVKSIQDTFLEINGLKITITISCGVSEFNHNQSANQWIDCADEALYLSKGAGRNRVSINS